MDLITLFLLVILFSLSALFSASETALFSLSKLKLRRIKNNQPRQYAAVVNLLDHPRRTLITILTGNNIVNISATSLVAAMALKIFGPAGIGISIVFMSVVLLLVGEMVPKSLAIRDAEAISASVARLLDLFARLVAPVCQVLQFIANLFLRILLGRREKKEPFVTQDELESLVSISQREGVIDKEEEDMIQTVFDFSERELNEIMVPRVDIVAAEITTPRAEIIKLLKRHRFSRIPVYEKGIDQVRGVINARDFILRPREDWGKTITPVTFVPETMKIEDLFVELQTNPVKMAMVVDEYGGCAGLVTMEDVLEELVGEIQDEHDKEVVLVRQVEKNKWRVDGKTTLWDLNEDYRLGIEDDERAETIGGFLFNLFGRIPKTGEEIDYRNLHFRVDEVKGNRIGQVYIIKKS